MLTHVDQVLAHEQQRPDDVWLTQPMGDGTVRTLTWREAIGEARRAAAHLREVLPRPSQVAIFAKNNAWWIVTDLAIAMAGHVSVPIYPTLTTASIRQILDHSETKLIVIGKLDGFDAMEPGIPPGLPRIAMPLGPATGTPWADIIARTAPLAPDEARRAPDDLATIIYTSGSTGVPKGAMHSFRTMAAATAFAERLNVSGDDRFLSYLPLAHAYERAVVETVSFKTGAQIYFTERLETFIDDLRRARPTVFVSVPRLWTRFQQAVFEKLPPAKLAALLADPAMREPVRMQVLAGLGLASVRYAGTGSAPMPAELLGWYRELGLELLEGYAMTENFCVSHATRIGEVKLGYCGRPQDGVEQRLTADGEVLVKSPGTMLGYFKAPDLTAAMIDRDGFLHTGDRGEVDELGRLKITGRVKELFKTSKGKYVAPAPIENALLVHDDVEQALVSGAGMPQPFGMIVLSDAARARAQREADRAALAESLAAHLEHTNARLDPHERLDRVVVVRESWTIENDMLTPTMKVRRDVIERHYADRVAAWYEAAHRVVWA
jgi:long-subunit acyl-CoA synthetase (AMP-forming)